MIKNKSYIFDDLLKNNRLIFFILLKVFNIFKKKVKLVGRNFYMNVYKIFKWTFKDIFSLTYSSYPTDERNTKLINLSKSIIFVFWYQGYDYMPSVCKKCFDSLRKFNKDKEVILLTKDNFSKFTKMDEGIIQCLKHNKISLTHFSDILRLKLLSEYCNAIWCDATLLFTSSIPNSFFDLDYVNISKQSFSNEKDYRIYPNFSFGNVYFIGGNNKDVFKFAYCFWVNYLKKYHCIYDYFTTAMVLNYYYEFNKKFKDDVNKVPLNNEKSEMLLEYCNKKYDKSYDDRLFSKETFFYKLNWHREYFVEINSELTFYGYLLKKYEI